MPLSLGQWIRDLRHAARALRRAPGFTLMAVGTLGLAIGATAGMFSVVNKVLVEPFPYPHADRLVRILGTAPGTDLPDEFGLSAEFYLQYKEQSRLLEDVAFYNQFTSTMRAGDRVERIVMSAPPASLFTTLGARPHIGRLPVAADEDRVAVLSYGLWQSWFGGDPRVLGRSYFMAGNPRTVVGVMEPGFRFPSADTLVWLTSHIRAEGLTPGQFGVPFVARIAEGTSIDAVARELDALARRLPERFGGSANYAQIVGRYHAIVQPLDEALLGGVTRPLWVLFAATAIVLLIACANVANLFMVRAEARQRDFAVRRAIGATRAQLIRVQASEAIVIAGLSAAVALVVSSFSLPAFLRAAPDGIPRLSDVEFTGWTVVFTIGAAALAAIVCGFVPALRASGAQFARLRDAARGTTRGRPWGRDGLVVAQTALALVLLIGSGLLVRSFYALRHVDPGYDTRDLFTFQIAPEGPHLRDPQSFARFDLEFIDRLRALPGVDLVGLVENIPLNEGTAGARFQRDGVAGAADTGPLLKYTFAAGDYFNAMGIDVRAGRVFTTDDHLQALPNVIVSRSSAETLWPNQNAIGKLLLRQDMKTWHTVVGVVDDVKQLDFRERVEPLVYFPLVAPGGEGFPISSPAFVIKTSRAETIAPEVRALVREVAPEAPMYRVYTMAGLASNSMQDVSFTMLTLGVASGLALLLGAVGLYGTLSYIVAQRTREIGVRMALGARTDQVRRMVVLQGAKVVMTGVVIGVGIAFWMTTVLSSLLYGVTASDVPTFVGMSAAMLGIGFIASYVPARRASKVDPIVALQGE
jgi:putative ABC transport system permease protein